MGRFVHEKFTPWSPYRLISAFVFMFQVMFFMFGLPFNKLKCENVTKLNMIEAKVFIKECVLLDGSLLLRF